MLCTEDGTAPSELRAGTIARIQGTLLTLRDASANRLFSGHDDPATIFSEHRPDIFFAAPTTDDNVSHLSIGPTTTRRFEPFFKSLTDAGVQTIIGKGAISESAANLLTENNICYLQAVGGIAAYYGERVQKMEIAAYPDLGPEAIYRLTIADFPVVVTINNNGEVFS